MGPEIQVQGLTKAYKSLMKRKEVKVLSDLDLSVSSGDVLGIIGPNGSGKTTLIGLMLGLLRPDQGEILVDGLPCDDLRVRARLGYVPERLTFDTWMSGLDYVSFHHELSGRPTAQRREECCEILRDVGLPEKAWGQRIKNYSRGTLQRIGLAQALVGKPDLLFLDEPTSGMDPEGVLMFRRVLAERCKGATVVINSHQLEQVERVCTRVAFIRDGRVQAERQQGQERVGARTLRVRLLGGWHAEALVLEQALRGAGGKLLEQRPGSIRLEVGSDEASVAALKALGQLGGQVVEAVPESSSIEQLFHESLGD